jgi:thioredoxin-related protein
MMKKAIQWTLALAFLGVLASFALRPQAEVKWYTLEEAMALNQQAPRKIFIDVYTDWCGWCKVMDKKTFSNPVIAKILNDEFYAVKFDAEQSESVTFKGREFKFVASGRKGYHELAAALLQGRMSYPSVVFLDEELNLLTPVPGYRPPSQMEPMMRFFADNAYKNTPWETFNASYKPQAIDPE